MAYIIPALLTSDPEVFIHRLHMVKNFADRIHIDIMDNTYVPNSALPLDELRDILNPMQVTNGIELHLMVEKPARYFDQIKQIDAVDSVIIHIDSDTPEAITEAIALYHDAGKEVGICYPLDAVIHDVLSVDFCLVLAIDRPGFSGAVFSEKAFSLIQKLKKVYNTTIEVDGGINDVTGKACLDAGADRLIVNSYIYNSKNPLKTLRLMQHLT